MNLCYVYDESIKKYVKNANAFIQNVTFNFEGIK